MLPSARLPGGDRCNSQHSARSRLCRQRNR